MDPIYRTHDFNLVVPLNFQEWEMNRGFFIKKNPGPNKYLILCLQRVVIEPSQVFLEHKLGVDQLRMKLRQNGPTL